MLNFVKLAQGQTTESRLLVSNSNVVGGSDSFSNFDQKFSQINLAGFEGNIAPPFSLNKEAKAEPEQYLTALHKHNISHLGSSIQSSIDFISRNEQYMQYRENVKKILKEKDCQNIGELISGHGNTPNVLSALTNLQDAFQTDVNMKNHYEKTVNNINVMNDQMNDLRSHLNRDLDSGVEAVQHIAEIEYNGSIKDAHYEYSKDMGELIDMRNQAILSINDTIIPFVDGDGLVVEKLNVELQNDQEKISEVSKLDLNAPVREVHNVQKLEQEHLASEHASKLVRENENTGPSL